jgi:hypothetical protein
LMSSGGHPCWSEGFHHRGAPFGFLLHHSTANLWDISMYSVPWGPTLSSPAPLHYIAQLFSEIFSRCRLATVRQVNGEEQSNGPANGQDR